MLGSSFFSYFFSFSFGFSLKGVLVGGFFRLGFFCFFVFEIRLIISMENLSLKYFNLCYDIRKSINASKYFFIGLLLLLLLLFV